MNQFSRNLMLWAAIVLAMVMLFNMFQQPQSSAQKVSYTDFISRVDGGQISSVEIQGNTLIGRGPDGASVQTYAPRDNELVSRLLDKKVEVKAQPPEEQPWYMTLLVSWFPMLLLIGVWIFFMRQMQGGGGKVPSGRRSALGQHDGAQPPTEGNRDSEPDFGTFPYDDLRHDRPDGIPVVRLFHKADRRRLMGGVHAKGCYDEDVHALEAPLS